MKKISEMNEDELRDYALHLEEENKSFQSKEEEYKGKIEDLDNLNKALQKRNNDLFVKVEQQGTVKQPEEKPVPEEKTETCEDFARRLLNKE